MRKLVLSLLAVAVLGAGTAFAQSGLWAGISTGWPGAAVHFGVENVFEGIDVRANVTTTYGLTFGLGVDGIYGLDLDVGTLPLDTYVGGGLDLFVGTFGVGINAFGGIEYRLGELGLPEGGIFLEVGPNFRVVPGFVFGIDAHLGFNYHF